MSWVNSDAYNLPGAFGFVVDFFARHPDVDVIYGHRILIDETSCEIGRWHLPEHDEAFWQLYDLYLRNPLLARRVWEKAAACPSFKFALDWDLLAAFPAGGARIGTRAPLSGLFSHSSCAKKRAPRCMTLARKKSPSFVTRTFGRPLAQKELENNPTAHPLFAPHGFVSGIYLES